MCHLLKIGRAAGKNEQTPSDVDDQCGVMEWNKIRKGQSPSEELRNTSETFDVRLWLRFIFAGEGQSRTSVSYNSTQTYTYRVLLQLRRILTE